MNTVTLEGTQELMKHRDVAVILATGGMGLVRAAYSAGKPAYGVGPGNAPCYIEQSADLAKAASDIIVGKCFDNGLLCSSPNSVVVDRAVAGEVRRELIRQGARFLSKDEADRLAAVLVSPQRLPNPKLVGKPATFLAEQAGFSVEPSTRVLVVELNGVGREYPLSIEKLCPVLSYYEVADWREGCERCIQILRYGGMGHTMSVHSRNDQVILEFGLKKPAFRIVVNTPTTHGSIGLTTGLDPSMTLGCGGYGGNITSDNISPKHLLNVKRVAYELRPATAHAQPSMPGGDVGRVFRPGTALPKAPAIERAPGIAASDVQKQFEVTPAPVVDARPAAPTATSSGDQAAAFVCEDDVKQAIREGRKIVIGERTIVTPAARDLAEPNRVFVQSSWPRP
jgi:acetaldehyde dehydrogenase (acetylating)